ncbi:alpha/beta hydrolase [Microbacterium sp. X-17]|uniref:alpha/beta fold hydrolase n=1 Tax=Microbacterium sp. X-17 TaxID=3144404 RepID=UPI0031F565FF
MTLTEEGLMPVPGMLSRWVRLPGGTKAHYMTSGETGPAVVLLHGGIAGSSGTAGFRFMAPFLGAHGFRVYCPSQPGYGLTEDPAEFYTADEAGHVDFIHDFTSALCLDRFHLGGNSMGSNNTVNYVVAHPERVLSFALIPGGVGDLVDMRETFSPKNNIESRGWKDGTGFDGTADSMRRSMTSVVLDPAKVTDDLVEMRTAVGQRSREAYERYMANIMPRLTGERIDPNYEARMRTKGRLDEITIPGIYVWGTQDVLMAHDVDGYRQEDALPRVQFFYPENAGHQGQNDQPELFNDVFLEFFRDGKVSWETAQRAGISQRRAPNPDIVAAPAAAPSPR